MKFVLFLLALAVTVTAFATDGDAVRVARQQRLKGVKAFVAVYNIAPDMRAEVEGVLKAAGIQTITAEEAQKYPEANVAYVVCDAMREQEATLRSTDVYVTRIRVLKVVSLPNNPAVTGQLELWEWHRIVVCNLDVDKTPELSYGKLRNAFSCAAHEFAGDWVAGNSK